MVNNNTEAMAKRLFPRQWTDGRAVYGVEKWQRKTTKKNTELWDENVYDFLCH